MDISSILFPFLAIGGLGVLLGLGLGYASKVFEVKTDERVALVRDALPGANCGGCGFPGCDGFAQAVVDGAAKVTGCPVGGADTAAKIAEIMGVSAESMQRHVSFNKCNGDCEKAKFRYEYFGLNDCNAAVQLAGAGCKDCSYGCIGNGSCKNACKFDAISIINGIAVIDTEKCTACGMCVPSCPKKLIELVPDEKKVRVACNSNDKGKDVRAYCKVGCIACKRCEKACEFDAIHVNDNLARVDYEKCTLCMECVKVCPNKTIGIIGPKGEIKTEV